MRPAWSVRTSTKTGSKATEKPCLEKPKENISQRKKTKTKTEAALKKKKSPMTHTSNSNHSRLREEDLKFEISWSYIEAIPPHLKTEKKKVWAGKAWAPQIPNVQQYTCVK